MSHPFTEELQAGLAAVRAAAAICQTVQSTITPDVLDKKDNSPVTIADFASQAAICHAISQAFPADPIIAEEDSFALHQPENQQFLADIQKLIQRDNPTASPQTICEWIDRGGAKNYSPRFWTLDPIDGTKGFLRRDQYAVSLALIIDGEIQLGILGCPNLGSVSSGGHSLFYAVRGHGAYSMTLEPDSQARHIHATPKSDPALARFCESFESAHTSHSESSIVADRLGITAPPLRMDSQAKYATVATGDADVYLRLPSKTGYFEKIWDHAGGVIIVQEAGGRVTDLMGNPLDFSLGSELRKNRGVIVTNGHLHDAVLTTVQSVFAGKSE
ncbi:3'(2'),5'-bisphosphate nucleotidase [Schlesneria paludicola]|uniref:3'(2'),5'-bisphosphate nucleotidase n=1 Tax=Schlesneria paludicola TaxID=360056 RepID=UPI00029A3BE4|nr:3'(2'),5'-bisphosphate nucleotidase [Schlesneria paludicola]